MVRRNRPSRSSSRSPGPSGWRPLVSTITLVAVHCEVADGIVNFYIIIIVIIIISNNLLRGLDCGNDLQV